MLKLLKGISRYGVSIRQSKSINRTLFITNVTAMILACGMAMLFSVHTLSQGFETSILAPAFMTMVCISIPYLNRNGHFRLSRYLLNINIVYGILCMTIIRKLDGLSYESTYFVSRSAIMVFAIAIPAALFHFSELKSLLINVFISGLALILYDPVHNFFGAGYYQLGNTEASYYYNNFFFLLLFSVMALILGYLKMNLEKYETRYEETIQILSEQNRKMGKQKNELAEKNSVLIEVLNEKDQNLLTINQELVRQNNDLLQFSYAISHNVRGPVASIMGIVNLIDGNVAKSEEIPQLLKHLSEGAHSLDLILIRLNQILAAKDDTFNMREEVHLKAELKIIEESFAKPIQEKGVKFEYKINAEKLFAVKAYILSILSQLIANAIQFRSESRRPLITVSSYYKDSSLFIQIEDNGQGINLKRHGEDIFKPFKRFHPTASGKGIGLYLAKLQVEKLNGSLDIKSIPDVGSCVTIRFESDSKSV